MQMLKKLLFLSAVCLCMLSIFLPMSRAAPYSSYTYDYWQQRVPSPAAYVPEAFFTGSDLGTSPFRQPRDIKVGPNRQVFIADTGNHRIVVVNDRWELVKVIDQFTDEHGARHHFASPTGLSITADGAMYVADRDHARVVHLTTQGDLIRIIGAPQSDPASILPQDFNYRPRRVAVDPLGRIYVIAEDVYDGVLWFDSGGSFRGFLGAPRVTPTAADLFWSRVATEEQRARMRLFLPIEFSSIDIAPTGFLYVTVAGPPEDESVRLLNPSGIDVLRRTGFHPPRGDFDSWDPERTDRRDAAQRFVDIAGRTYGRYSILERTRGRIFTYDGHGNLLYVFGGIGDIVGRFRHPSALTVLDERILVLDNNRITVFEPTRYAKLIHGAIEAYNSGQYDRSTHLWQEVLRANANFDLAYSGIGRALYLQGEYEQAMQLFQLGQNREGYSAAFAEFRRVSVHGYFGWLVSGFVLALGAVFGWPFISSRVLAVPRRSGSRMLPQTTEPPYKLSSRRAILLQWLTQTGDSLWYSLHIMFHPFDGFWDLKHEKRGSLVAASILVLLVTASYIFMRQYTAFVHNERDLRELNIFVELASVLVPFLLWCAVNWALTTLMEGKGTYRDIFVSTAYALTPLIVVNIPNTILSHVLTIEEGTFFSLLLAVGVIWAVVLMVLATMVVHEYSGLKTVVSIVLIIGGMSTLLFLGLLFSTLVAHMLRFIISIYHEINYRL